MVAVACDEVSILSPQLLCSSWKYRRKSVLLFSGSKAEVGESTCEKVQKMFPVHLEVLCVGKDWYVAAKGKIQFHVNLRSSLIWFLMNCFHLKRKLSLWSHLGETDLSKHHFQQRPYLGHFSQCHTFLFLCLSHLKGGSQSQDKGIPQTFHWVGYLSPSRLGSVKFSQPWVHTLYQELYCT